MISQFPVTYILVQYIVMGNERVIRREMDRVEWKFYYHLLRKRRWEHKLDYENWLDWVGGNL